MKPTATSKPAKVAVLLGFGSSTTSQIAKGLHLAGFPMGDQQLVDLNSRIMASEGYAWDRLPPVHLMDVWTRLVDNYGGEAREYLLGRFYTTGQFGISDPRVTALWPLWDAALHDLCHHLDPILVVCQRDVKRAGASVGWLNDKMLRDEAEHLVDQYQWRTRLILQGLWQVRPART